MRGVSSFLRMTPEITCRQGASTLIVLDGAFSGSDHRCARCSMQQLLSELRNSNLRHHFSALRRSLSSLMMTTRFRRALGCGVWLIGVLDRGNNFAIRGFETERKLPVTIQTGKGARHDRMSSDWDDPGQPAPSLIRAETSTTTSGPTYVCG